MPWRALEGGVELAVRLTPRGGAARIDGIAEHGGRPCLKVRVAAPPAEGAANAALVAFIARSLGVPRSSITIATGGHARVKRLVIRDPRAADRLAALLS